MFLAIMFPIRLIWFDCIVTVPFGAYIIPLKSTIDAFIVMFPCSEQITIPLSVSVVRLVVLIVMSFEDIIYPLLFSFTQLYIISFSVCIDLSILIVSWSVFPLYSSVFPFIFSSDEQKAAAYRTSAIGKEAANFKYERSKKTKAEL